MHLLLRIVFTIFLDLLVQVAEIDRLIGVDDGAADGCHGRETEDRCSTLLLVSE